MGTTLQYVVCLWVIWAYRSLGQWLETNEFFSHSPKYATHPSFLNAELMGALPHHLIYGYGDAMLIWALLFFKNESFGIVSLIKR